MPFQVVRNDITKMQVDAIVNTANPLPTFGPGTDAAIYKAAGQEQLLEKRKEIGNMEPGTSVITEGFNLPAKYIIHTVGTSWQGGNENEADIIRNCYRSVFDLAKQYDVETLAFPVLASGSYGFPKGIALRIAFSEIERFLTDNDMMLFLVVFDQKSYTLSSEFYGDVDTYINDHYVEQKEKEEYDSATFNRENRKSRGIGSFFQKVKDFAAPIDDDDEYEYYEDVEMPAVVLRPQESLDDVLNNRHKTFMEMVFTFADERGLSDVDVQKRANLDRKAFSKLKCGTTKNPSKNTALAIAVALELDLDETKDLLSRAGLALSPVNRQDLIVRYYIEHGNYNIYRINEALFEHNEKTLGMQIF